MRALASLLKPTPTPAFEVVRDDGGLTLLAYLKDEIEPRWTIRWRDITEISAWKDDCVTTDLICIGLNAVGRHDQTFSFDEDTPGYEAAIAELERRFTLPEDWWSEVAFPPFHECHRTLWRAAEDHSLGGFSSPPA